MDETQPTLVNGMPAELVRYRIGRVMQMLDIGRTTFYKMRDAGLPVEMLEGVPLVPHLGLMEFLAKAKPLRRRPNARRTR
jgi:hypothetical protein